MFYADKDTEIYCIADDSCKQFGCKKKRGCVNYFVLTHPPVTLPKNYLFIPNLLLS